MLIKGFYLFLFILYEFISSDKCLHKAHL